MTVPAYVVESSPIHLRGTMIVIFQLLITFGQFFASILGGIFSLDWAKPATVGWRYTQIGQ